MQNKRIRQLEEFLKTDPDNAMMQFCLGQEYLKANEAGKAIPSLRNAIRIQEDYSAAYKELGRALAEEGNTEEAVQTYRQGIAVADKRGDLQTAKEMRVFLKRISPESLPGPDSCCE